MTVSCGGRRRGAESRTRCFSRLSRIDDIREQRQRIGAVIARFFHTGCSCSSPFYSVSIPQRLRERGWKQPFDDGRQCERRNPEYRPVSVQEEQTEVGGRLIFLFCEAEQTPEENLMLLIWRSSNRPIERLVAAHQPFMVDVVVFGRFSTSSSRFFIINVCLAWKHDRIVKTIQVGVEVTF